MNGIHYVAYQRMNGDEEPPDSGLIFFFGERADETTDPPSGDPLDEHDAFMAYMGGTVDTETFEAAVEDFTPSFVTTYDDGESGTFTATWTPDLGDGVDRVNEDGGAEALRVRSGIHVSGRYNTTPGGNQWMQFALPVAIDFSKNISAFGLYFTDLGDFGNAMTVELTDEDDVVTVHEMGNTVDGPDSVLTFWGFVDTSGLGYKRVKFVSTGETVTPGPPDIHTYLDFTGCDDVVAARFVQLEIP